MVSVIAHRGLRSEKPENTREAIAAAIAVPGVSGVEFDVELTNDGKLVVLHQETVVPSADFSRLELGDRNYTSRDWVRERSEEQIVALDAGHWMGEVFAGITVPKLSQVLELPWGAVTAYVELKDATFWGNRELARPKAVVDAALECFATYSGEFAVISFNPEILRVLSSRAPGTKSILALWTEWQGREDEALAIARECGAQGVSLPYEMVLSSALWTMRAQAHEHRLEVHAYPVSPARNEAEYVRWTAESQVEIWRKLADAGVTAIVSDFARESVVALRDYSSR